MPTGRAGARSASLPPRPSRSAGCKCLSPACIALRARAAGRRPRGVECAPASRPPPPWGARTPGRAGGSARPDARCGLCVRSWRGDGVRVSSWRRAVDGVPLLPSPSPTAAVGRDDLPDWRERRNRGARREDTPTEGGANLRSGCGPRPGNAECGPARWSPVTARAGPEPSAPPDPPSSSLPTRGSGDCVLGAGAPVLSPSARPARCSSEGNWCRGDVFTSGRPAAGRARRGRRWRAGGWGAMLGSRLGKPGSREPGSRFEDGRSLGTEPGSARGSVQR